MYWYNPTTRTSERAQAPSTDEQAIQMLAGTKESAEVHKGVLRAAPLGITDRASLGVGGPRVSLEGAGGSAGSPLGSQLLRIPFNALR